MLKLNNLNRSSFGKAWCTSEPHICPKLPDAQYQLVTKEELEESDSKLYEFARAVLKAFPYDGLNFYRTNSRQTLFVQFNGDMYASGYLYYGVNTYSGARTQTYAVYSPFIRNNKYANHNADYHMSHTGDMARAVKTATAKLRRIPHDMVADRVARAARATVEREHTAHGYEHNKKVNNLIGSHGFSASNKLHRELLHLVETEYEFLDPAFGEELKTLAKEHKEIIMAEQEYNDEWFILFVRKNSKGSDEVVITKILVNGPPEKWSRSFNADEYAYIAEPNEVPETLQGVMALLQMVEDGHYVENVGVKLADGSYFACTEKGSVDLEACLEASN